MIVGRNPDKLAAAVKDIEALKTGAIGYEPADITDEEQTLRVVDAATAWHGRLHGVVHCAGGSQTIGPITQIDSQAWRRTVDLNVNGTMYVLKHAARELVRGGGGSFVGISSIAASNTHRWFGAYGVTKSAVDHMMKLAADELGPSWVRVNSIRPGLIRTDLVVPVTESPELSADYRVCTPLPRVGEVEDVANLAMFCSATRPVGSPDRSSTSTAATCCEGARTSRPCWSRCSAPTGCVEWSDNLPSSRRARRRHRWAPLVRCRVGGGAAAVQRICAGFGGRRGGGGLVGCR